MNRERRIANRLKLSIVYWVLSFVVAGFVLIGNRESVQAGRITTIEGFFNPFGLMALGLAILGVLHFLSYLHARSQDKNKR